MCKLFDISATENSNLHSEKSNTIYLIDLFPLSSKLILIKETQCMSDVYVSMQTYLNIH